MFGLPLKAKPEGFSFVVKYQLKDNEFSMQIDNLLKQYIFVLEQRIVDLEKRIEKLERLGRLNRNYYVTSIE